MTREELQQTITQLAPQATFEENSQFLIAEIQSEEIHKVAQALKESSNTQFDYLFSMTGVDIQPELGVVYHLESTNLKHTIVLKTKTSRENPQIPTMSDLWKGAELQEREIFDFFGIKFTNHPDLRRIFMEDDWEGYPLRKDYSDPINIVDLIK